MTLPIGILASGAGTNFEAIADAIESGRLDAEIRIAISNRAGSPVLAKAAARGVPTATIPHGEFASRADFDAAVADRLAHASVSLVVLAGFDRIVGATLLSRFPERVLNIHPALLPAFRGSDAQAQAVAYGVKIAGATVHLVDEDVDHGPIIVQAAIAVTPGESVETVRERILEQEHRIYPYALQLFAEDRVRIVGRRVVIAGYETAPHDPLISPPVPDPTRHDRGQRTGR